MVGFLHNPTNVLQLFGIAFHLSFKSAVIVVYINNNPLFSHIL